MFLYILIQLFDNQPPRRSFFLSLSLSFLLLSQNSIGLPNSPLGALPPILHAGDSDSASLVITNFLLCNNFDWRRLI